MTLRPVHAALLLSALLACGPADTQTTQEPACEEQLGLCPESHTPVAVCPPDATCVTLEACGAQQLCQCTGAPSCADATSYAVQVETCDTSNGQCETVTRCGQSILCQYQMIPCTELAACPEGTHEVDACRVEGPQCARVEGCGDAIFCEELPGCQAMPSCPGSSTQVTRCPDDDLTCTPQTLCGHTIFCDDASPCEGFATCPTGSQRTPACDANDPDCRELTFCDATIRCQYAPGCAPQDVYDMGSCGIAFGYAWSGSRCYEFKGCSCQGTDCNNLYADKAACEAARTTCR